MRLLDRYVLAAFLKNYLISFMVLVGLYILLDLVFNFDELIEVQTRAGSATGGGASFLAVIYVIFDYYFYQIFLIFAQLSGIIPVVAAAFTLVRLARFNELTAMLAAGVPLLRVAAPIIFAALGLNVLLFVDQELIVPRLIPKLTRSHDQAGQPISTKSFEIKSMQDGGGGLIFASRYTPPTDKSPATMLEFDVIERDAALQPVAHISADRADFDPTRGEWKLKNGKRITGLAPNEPRSRERDWPVYKSDVTPEEIALFRSGDYVELLSTARINQLLQRSQSYGVVSLLRVKHARLTQFVMNLIIVLIGIACILTREPGTLKASGIKLLILVAVVMATVFICHQLAEHPPGGEQWTDRWPALMAWLPIFLFAPLAIWLLDRLHTRKS